MKCSILSLCLLLVAGCVLIEGTVPRDCMECIRQTETGGLPDPLNAVGDSGYAIGPFQIWQNYWYDAQQYDSSLTANGETYRNCMGRGSLAYSERVVQAYMRRYATVSRLGRQATCEDFARIHNGGPNGFRYTSTLPYWRKVQNCLQ